MKADKTNRCTPPTVQSLHKIVHRGSAFVMAAVMGAVITGVVALSLTKVWNSSYSVLNMTSLRNQAMQYALNGADMARSTRYDDLVSKPLDKIEGTDFYRSVTVEDDASVADRKVATVKVFGDINDTVPLAQMVVKKSRINEVLYDTIGTNTDGAMTQEASSRLFAMSDTAVKHTAGTAVGSTTRPVYVDTDGNVKVLSGTVGSATEAIYLKNGVFTKISGGSGCIKEASLGQNGYVLFYNGFQICWGKNTTSGQNPRTVTLPRAFLNTSFAIFSSSAHQAGYGETRAWISSASQIKVAAYGSGEDGNPFYWLAIGQGA